MKITSLLAAAGLGLAAAGEVVPLKDVYPFKIGTCVNARQVAAPSPAEERLLAGTFNTLTPENELKPVSVQPREGEWRFAAGDRFVAFAERHGMAPIGHCLVWHSQVGAWMFRGGDGARASRALALARMRTHIHAVVGRYRGRIKGWDVVNEALADDGSLRRSPWLECVGPDYIEWAFRYAREADPGCELYYNDYGLDNPRKRAGALRLVRELKAKGLRLDAVGMQTHHRLKAPSLKDYEASLAAFAAAGVKVMATEVDVSVLPAAWGLSADVARQAGYAARYDPYRSGLPPEKQRELAERYCALFAIYLRHADAVTRVTFWGFCDRSSWLNNFPVRGRVDHPLLYDRDLAPKPCARALAARAPSPMENGK